MTALESVEGDTVHVAVVHNECGANVVFTVECGETVAIGFVNHAADGASMADTLMVAMRDATRIDATPNGTT